MKTSAYIVHGFIISILFYGLYLNDMVLVISTLIAGANNAHVIAALTAKEAK